MSYEAPHYVVFSNLSSLHLSSVQIYFTTLFSNTLNARDQVSHPYRPTDKIIVLYILIFMFLDSSREDKILHVFNMSIAHNITMTSNYTFKQHESQTCKTQLQAGTKKFCSLYWPFYIIKCMSISMLWSISPL
jgi:hypothetical protein